MGDSIQVTINGKLYVVGAEESISSRLVTFIRDKVGTGTHITCYQGGCGACTVVATAPDPATGGTKTFSINSCLASLYNCDGWSITTIEGLGNREDGYHVIQERLAEHYGTQCGYCSPAMVMNMYGLTQEKGTWTDDDVEKHLDGHICRCTGYRPILAAFKSITPADIEDIDKTVCAKSKTGGCCKGAGIIVGGSGCCQREAVQKAVTVDGVTFYSPTTTAELLSILGGLPAGASYAFMFGNTAVGWSGSPRAANIISTRKVSDLASVKVTTTEVTAGAAVSLTTLRAALQQAKDLTGFSYLQQVDDHLQKLASSSIRNLGGWTGNLALKMQDQSFPSDFFLTAVAAEAQVLLGVPDGSSTWYSVESLLGRDLTANKEVMLTLRYLPHPDNSYYRSYKVAPRNTLALAFVGAAHKIQVGDDFIVTGAPVLAYSGISSSFNRAKNTEDFLVGKDLRDGAVLQNAFASLDAEVVPDAGPGLPDPAFKKQVAQALLYKTIMSIVSEKGGTVDTRYLSGATSLVRPLSSGTQAYDDNQSTWPLGQPIPKLEAKAQCAGEVKYINDAPFLADELTGRFVLSTRANATIVSIDASAALTVPGIVGFVSASDIKGINSMQPFNPDNIEPVFAEGKVSYYGQAIGMVVGDSSAVRQAANLVQVTYADEQTPVLTIADSIATGRPSVAFDPLVIGDVDGEKI